jgi:hypothetical protein
MYIIMLKTLIDFWQDDTGLDDHVSKLLYAAMGFVVGGLIITSVGLALRNKGVSLGNDIKNFAVDVQTNDASKGGNDVKFTTPNDGTTVTKVTIDD